MAKKQAQEVEDLLDDDAPPAKKTAAKKAAAPASAAKSAKGKKAEPEPPAKKTKGKKAEPEEDAGGESPSIKRKREPLVWEEGEQATIRAKVKKVLKKPMNSRELAEKVGTTTRKLRTVLYSMARAEEIELETGETRVGGMTVNPA